VVVVIIVGEKIGALEPPSTSEPPPGLSYQSIVQPSGGVALKVTVPLPQRALALAPVGATGSGFSLTLCVPFITAAQFPPSAITCAVYVPAPENAPVNVVAPPVPANTFITTPPSLYNR
jgi:hypothetical protein